MDPETLCWIEPLSCWAKHFSFHEAAEPVGNACAHAFLGMCLVTPEAQSGGIFGFPEFVPGFALLALIFTVSEVRYRFRIEAAPIPIYPLTFWLAAILGIGTLLTDVWFAEQYPIPRFLSSRAIWQAAFGGVFLILVLAWLWSSFVRPTKFGRLNRYNFTATLFRYLLRGAETDLPAIAAELARSAPSIIKYAQEAYPRPRGGMPSMVPTSRYARDILLLIGMRKFCRHIVASAPGTAMAFFIEMTKQKKYHIPIGQFASNISTEAILNKDSILYHEDEGFYSGYFGYVRPFTTAVYGDFSLVEALTRGNSPLDIPYNVRWEFDGDHLAAYARAVLTTVESALEAGAFYSRSAALYRAFDNLEHACHDLYKLDETPDNPASEDIRSRLHVVVSFANKAIDLIDKDAKAHGLKSTKLRRHDASYMWNDDLYDAVANLMFEIIKHAANIKRKDFSGWSVQHNAVWGEFFKPHESEARIIVLFKIRRLIYEEIRTIERFPNFANAALLGYCLNVMGLTVGKKRDFRSQEFALRKVVISWAKRNYLWMVGRSPKAAAAALMGMISFDAENRRLVKTYSEGLRAEPPREYLCLDEPTQPVTPIDE